MGRLVSSGSKEKKVDLIYSEQLLRVVISTFKGQKKIKIFLKHFSNRIEKLHEIDFIKNIALGNYIIKECRRGQKGILN